GYCRRIIKIHFSLHKWSPIAFTEEKNKRKLEIYDDVNITFDLIVINNIYALAVLFLMVDSPVGKEKAPRNCDDYLISLQNVTSIHMNRITILLHCVTLSSSSPVPVPSPPPSPSTLPPS
ncbi:hypothetical protein GQX74_003194, partial [Glossina fuscipes]